MPIDLTTYADAIDHARAEGTICVLATTGAEGGPDIGLKGSMMVLDQDHLAYWERTLGQHLENLRRSPGAAVLYFNRERRQYVRFFGQADLYREKERVGNAREGTTYGGHRPFSQNSRGQEAATVVNEGKLEIVVRGVI